jgi:hypothetical protein
VWKQRRSLCSDNKQHVGELHTTVCTNTNAVCCGAFLYVRFPQQIEAARDRGPEAFRVEFQTALEKGQEDSDATPPGWHWVLCDECQKWRMLSGVCERKCGSVAVHVTQCVSCSCQPLAGVCQVTGLVLFVLMAPWGRGLFGDAQGCLCKVCAWPCHSRLCSCFDVNVSLHNASMCSACMHQHVAQHTHSRPCMQHPLFPVCCSDTKTHTHLYMPCL